MLQTFLEYWSLWISESRAPLPVAAVGLDGQARRVVVDGNHAYVSIQGGIDVVDVSDPHRPFVQGNHPEFWRTTGQGPADPGWVPLCF